MLRVASVARRGRLRAGSGHARGSRLGRLRARQAAGTIGSAACDVCRYAQPSCHSQAARKGNSQKGSSRKGSMPAALLQVKLFLSCEHPSHHARLGSRRPVLARTRPPMAQFNASMHGHQPPSMLHSKATPSARKTRAEPAHGGTTLTSARGAYRRDAHVLFALTCMLWCRAQPAPPPHVAFRHRSLERQRACILRRRPIARH
jgi:hypothetical protein